VHATASGQPRCGLVVVAVAVAVGCQELEAGVQIYLDGGPVGPDELDLVGAARVVVVVGFAFDLVHRRAGRGSLGGLPGPLGSGADDGGVVPASLVSSGLLVVSRGCAWAGGWLNLSITMSGVVALRWLVVVAG
jgi:hypothetical protein